MFTQGVVVVKWLAVRAWMVYWCCLSKIGGSTSACGGTVCRLMCVVSSTSTCVYSMISEGTCICTRCGCCCASLSVHARRFKPVQDVCRLQVQLSSSLASLSAAVAIVSVFLDFVLRPMLLLLLLFENKRERGRDRGCCRCNS